MAVSNICLRKYSHDAGDDAEAGTGDLLHVDMCMRFPILENEKG